MKRSTTGHATKTPDRFLWAADVMQLDAAGHLLEIGCGVGLLAEQICRQLSSGQLIAIDRSASMIEKAIKRNHRFVESGKVRFIGADFLEAALPAAAVDTIVAFNVGFFGKESPEELEQIRALLKPSGKLFVFLQAPFEINLQYAKPFRENLLRNGFEIIGSQLKKLHPVSACCIIAQPNAKQLSRRGKPA
jgi:SAM-dependent methyltransferase